MPNKLMRFMSNYSIKIINRMYDIQVPNIKDQCRILGIPKLINLQNEYRTIKRLIKPYLKANKIRTFFLRLPQSKNGSFQLSYPWTIISLYYDSRNIDNYLETKNFIIVIVKVCNNQKSIYPVDTIEIQHNLTSTEYRKKVHWSFRKVFRDKFTWDYSDTQNIQIQISKDL